MPAEPFPHPSRRVINIAHRGASGHAPEHTIAAYDIALEMEADYLELDLRLTADGVLVAHHDANLQRTTGRAELVHDLTLEELRVLDVGSWFSDAHPDRARAAFAGLRVPTMAEVFERYGASTNYYIELKDPHLNPGVEAKFVDLLRASGLMEHALEARGVLVQSFDAESLARVRAMEPRLALIQLFSLIQSDAVIVEEMSRVATFAVGIGPEKFNVDEQLVARAHAHGLDVHPFTVDEPEEMASLIAAEVDGIFTNFPDRLTALLNG